MSRANEPTDLMPAELRKLANSLKRRSDGAGHHDTVQIAAHEAREIAKALHELAGEPELLPHEELAEFLNSIGWYPISEANLTKLRDNMAQIAELSRSPSREGVERG